MANYILTGLICYIAGAGTMLGLFCHLGKKYK